MARKPRFSISPLGEFYRDLLKVDSWINDRPSATQATSLLCAALQRREGMIRERLAYLAQKRGLTSDELWNQILKDEAEQLALGDIPADEDDA